MSIGTEEKHPIALAKGCFFERKKIEIRK